MKGSDRGIDASTKLCCLIGDPVEQSPSPQMHNSAFRAAGVNYVYMAFQVEPATLPAVINGFRAIGVRGFNVTIPHKVAVMKYIDEADSLSREVGAVNTVVNVNGRLRGFNTDVLGFIEPLKKKGVKLDGVKVLIVGAGGAARACIVGLIHEGCRELMVLNRSVKRAEELLQDIGETHDVDMRINQLSERSIEHIHSDVDLIVNSTPVGMYPNIGESIIQAEFIKSRMTVFDLVYKPVKTRLIQEAEKKGATTISGVEMLVEQAAASFKLWTGIEPPRQVMMQAALDALGESAE